LYVTLYIETIDQVLDNVRKEATDEDSLILTMGDDSNGVDFPYDLFSSVSSFLLEYAAIKREEKMRLDRKEGRHIGI
jgi:hypothetical protein